MSDFFVFTFSSTFLSDLSLMSTVCWQAATKWFEGVADQAIYYAISNDHGLTWGPTQLMPGTQDNLPAWGPVLYSAVSLSLKM